MKTKILFSILCITANVVLAQVPSYVPLNGLLGWWSFTGNANDLSGNNNNATVHGATLTTDRFGNANSAYSFDGITSYISVNTTLNLPDSFTISVWVKPYLEAAGPGGGNAAGGWEYSASLIDKNRDQSSDEGYSLLYSDSTTNNHGLYAQVGWSGDSNNVIISNIDLTIHQWNHCLFTVNNGTGNLYLNGNLIFTKTGLNSTAQNADTLLFGKAVWGGNLFDGVLDDIGIWNRALTQQEITNLYNGGICFQSVTVTDTLIINTGITGFNPITYSNELKVYPNPAKTQVIFDAGTGGLNGYTIKVINTLSQPVFTQVISASTYSVLLSTWTGSGTYFVQLYDTHNNLIDVREVIIQ